MWHQNKDTPIFDKVPNENPLCLSLLKMRPPSGCLWHLTIVRKRNIYKNVPRITNHQLHQIPLFMILVCRRPADNISRYQISDIMISCAHSPWYVTRHYSNTVAMTSGGFPLLIWMYIWDKWVFMYHISLFWGGFSLICWWPHPNSLVTCADWA